LRHKGFSVASIWCGRLLDEGSDVEDEMPEIAELQIGRKVTAVVGVGGRQGEGVIAGRRVNNHIEGDTGLRSDTWPQPDDGLDMMRVAFPPRRPGTLGTVATGLTCFPDSVELV
jgi:hypothetical protein